MLKIKAQPPIALKKLKKRNFHGDTCLDYYAWLEDRNDAAVLKYIKAENSYTENIMSATKQTQAKLYKEFLKKIKEKDLSFPIKIDNYYYYKKTKPGYQYPIYYRKKGSLKNKEELLLNPNTLVKKNQSLNIGLFQLSHNHQYLAFSLDISGTEKNTIYIKDLKNGKLLKDKITNTGTSLTWAADSQTFFYNVLDGKIRSYRIYRHRLGEDYTKDKLIFEEKDETFFTWVSQTKDKKYILLNSASYSSSESYFLDATRPQEDFKLIERRRKEIEYEVEHNNGLFYILTNDKALNFKVVKTSVKKLKKSYWKIFIPHNKKRKIEAFEMLKNHLILYERKDGLTQLHVFNLKTHKDHYICFPEPVYKVWKSANRNFDTDLFRFNYTSFVTPKTTFDYNLNTRHKTLKKQEAVLGKYDSLKYKTERIWAETADHTKIPISLVYKKGLRKNGQTPLVLVGYGAYGISQDVYFSQPRLSLLDRGFIIGIAHIRGGGEFGTDWHNQGKLLNKKNTFTDFITCCEYLIQKKYTSSQKMIITGGSAGGLLIGNVLNQRPDICKAAIVHVPFVDPLNTMLNPELPDVTTEYAEWGNPSLKNYYKDIKSYSPYENVKAQNYPHLLVTGGLNDPIVSYHEPLKWVAKLRNLKTDNNLLLLKINLSAGHQGSQGRYEYLQEIAFDYAFVLKILGIDL